jgi:hypothetical protein
MMGLTAESPVATICTTRFKILKLCTLPLERICVSRVRYGLPTQCICVFRTVLTANSDCFPKQH